MLLPSVCINKRSAFWVALQAAAALAPALERPAWRTQPQKQSWQQQACPASDAWFVLVPVVYTHRISARSSSSLLGSLG